MFIQIGTELRNHKRFSDSANSPGKGGSDSFPGEDVSMFAFFSILVFYILNFVKLESNFFGVKVGGVTLFITEPRFYRKPNVNS